MTANIQPSRIKAGLMTLTGTTSDGSTNVLKLVNHTGNTMVTVNTLGGLTVNSIVANNLPVNVSGCTALFIDDSGIFSHGVLTHTGLTNLLWSCSGHIGSSGAVPVFNVSGITIEADLSNGYVPYKSINGFNNSPVYTDSTRMMIGRTAGSEIVTIGGGIDMIGEIYQKNRQNYVNVERVVSNNAIDHLTIPTYDGSGQVVHPSIYYNSKKWNGYYYWMAMTPYPNGNSGYENPSIVVSNDGITWIVPSGLTNPIEPSPSSGYNLDPCLIEGIDGKLYCYFGQYISGVFYLYVKSSINGIDWSDKILLKSSSTKIYDSMSVIIENGQYNMWFVEPKVDLQKKLVVMSSDSPISGWDVAIETVCTINNLPSNFEIWHPDIRKFGNEYHGFFVVIPSGTTGVGTKPYFATSQDGFIWYVANNPLIDLGNSGAWDSYTVYKSTAVLVNDGINLKYNLWYSGTNNIVPNGSWHIGLTDVNFDYNQINEYQEFTNNTLVVMNVRYGLNATITLTGNTTITLSNLNNYDKGKIFVVQDGTSGNTLTIIPTPKVFNNGGGGVSLTGTINSIDIIDYMYLNNVLYVTINNNFT